MFELRTLGGLELLRIGDGDPHAIPMQAKRLALLAHLAALPPGTFRRRDTLLLLFWPDLDQEHARGALRQGLHFLRKTLGEGAILTRGEDEIGLDPAAVCSDARRLEAAVSGGDPETALALYRGDFLEGVFVSDAAPELEDWISIERSRLRGLAAKAAWTASELPANRDRVGELVRRAVQWSGDDEVALRRGVKILDGMGDRAGAAALYDEFARRVKRDFDVELSSETRSVIKALRARRASGHHVPPPVEVTAPVTAVAVPVASGSPRRPGKRLLLAGVAGALLVLALAAYMRPRGDQSRGVSSEPLTVLPFRVSEADSNLAWLGDGMVQLLTIRLAGAEGTGAGRVVEGSIAGTRQHLTMSASLSPVSGTATAKRAFAEGPADSVPQLVDRLAAQLLGMNAGVEEDRLPLLTGVSLPAVRRYIAGQSATRRADLETAFRLYSEALDLDSSFTLAGLQVCRLVIRASTGELRERGCRIARRGRDRLGSADRALLDANPDAWASAVEMFAGLDAALVAYPDRPENWYALGYAHFRMGLLMGEERWAERADEAFRRGWLLDSAAVTRATGEPPVAEPILQMVELAHLRYDTAEVVRLTGSLFAVDTMSDVARILKWHRAVVTGDAARMAFWSDIGSASQRVTMYIILFINWTGIGISDRETVLAEDQLRLRSHNPGFASFASTIEALNGGRPDDVPPEDRTPGLAADKVHRGRIRQTLSWDGDTVRALESVRMLAQSIAAPASGEGARQRMLDLCAVGEWQAARGDYAAAAKSISRLRQARIDSTMPEPGNTARHASLCLSLLDAMMASGLRLPNARERVAAADSVARELIFVICCGERISDANVQIARLWEREGDPRAALRAIERRSDPFRWAPVYMSTFLREEGRLAALTGDTARAVSAWRLYLAYRNNPQASLKPGVDSIRAQLAVLERALPVQR